MKSDCFLFFQHHKGNHVPVFSFLPTVRIEEVRPALAAQTHVVDILLADSDPLQRLLHHRLQVDVVFPPLRTGFAADTDFPLKCELPPCAVLRIEFPCRAWLL